MQNFSFVAALAAAALAAGAAVAAPASAPIRAEATLASPLSTPKDAVIGDVSWHCEAAKCVGAAVHPTLDSPMRECKKAAAELGAFAAYATRGRELSDGTLKTCNSVAAAKAGDAVTAQK